MKERDLTFFRPLWRRVAVTAVCVLWALFELKGGDQMWVMITLALCAYAVWMLFIKFPKDLPAAAASPALPAAGKDDDAPSQD